MARGSSSSTIGRFLAPDPATVGPNWCAYCGNSPLGALDPTGLRKKDLVKEDGTDGVWAPRQANAGEGWEIASNFSAGMGDTISFGATGLVRRWMGVDGVDSDSGWYKGGQAAGTVLMTAVGAGEGEVAAEGAEVALTEAGEAGEVAEEDAALCENGCCFVAGTIVLIGDGSSKPIEHIKAGDVVESRSESDPNGKLTKEPVARPIVRMTDRLVTIRLDSGQTINCDSRAPL